MGALHGKQMFSGAFLKALNYRPRKGRKGNSTPNFVSTLRHSDFRLLSVSARTQAAPPDVHRCYYVINTRNEIRLH